MEHRVKWLIVFLVQNVHETKQDTKFLNQTLRQLLEVGNDPDIGIVGCISTTAISGLMRKQLDTKPEGDGPVHSFLVRPLLGRRDTPGKRLEVLDQWSTTNYGLQDVSFVTKVLGMIKRRYIYDHVILTTWDHGSGYAIFTIPDNLGDEIPMKKKKRPASSGMVVSNAVVHHPDNHAPVHRMFHKDPLPLMKEPLLAEIAGVRGKKNLSKFKRLLRDFRWLSPPYGLTMDRLREAILGTFGKVDVIMMRNCYMQTFDTGFALRDVTDYLVATEGIMFFSAYSYIVWLKALRTVKGLTPETAAAKAVLGFTRAKVSDSFRTDTAMFGNDLSYYAALNAVMNRMIQQLILFVHDNEAKNKKLLLKCRREMTDIVRRGFPGADFQLVDAGFWFEKAGEFLPPEHNTSYNEALKHFQDLLVRTVGGRSFIGHRVGHGGLRCSGFSLYFPTFLRNIQRFMGFYEFYYAMNSPFRALATRSSLWDEFISYLYLDMKPHMLRKPITQPL